MIRENEELMKKENVGIVTTWFERGAAYVSRLYYEALQNDFNVFIFARGGEHTGKGNPIWDQPYVTWGRRYGGFKIDKREFFKWIEKNNISILFFNEQREYTILGATKEKFPNIKLGAYVDYYTEGTLPLFNLYDFLICNTKRHMQAMKFHKQSIYVRWGTNTSLYKPFEQRPIDINHGRVTFFHSVGMSPRKGTDILINTYIKHKLYEKSYLIIHTQIPIERVCNYNKDELQKYGIKVIQKTVTAPGLYYLGDIYVYPTRLDGLGLTMYEALSSGLPVITTDYPPMNEVVDESCGKLVKVESHYCRDDAYYWPMCLCDPEDLAVKMEYYIDNPNEVRKEQLTARNKALKLFDWENNKKNVVEAFNNASVFPLDSDTYKMAKHKLNSEKFATLIYIKNNSSIIWPIMAKRRGLD